MPTLTQGRPTGPASHSPSASASLLAPSDTFIHRHIGPTDSDIATMLRELGYPSLDAFSDTVVPASIRLQKPLNIGEQRGEFELLVELREIAKKNKVMRSCIGMGYYDCITPPVIQRNILENPGWYTQYTPYQAEISQGRLESLLNFQTMVTDLTALDVANASLLDEGTAAAEAMAMCHSARSDRKDFFIDAACHPQTINVVRTRAESMGLTLHVGNVLDLMDTAKAQGLPSLGALCGALIQYPNTYGTITNPAELQKLADKLHENKALFVVATDLLALTLIKPPGEFGADIAVGSAQRFGVPMGGGGPHAAFMATKNEFVRKMPGRLIGVSKDVHGNHAYRLAIQTREQHLNREKATSNICTAQALLANIAAMYVVYHGPQGLKRIAGRVNAYTALLSTRLTGMGWHIRSGEFFDTICIEFEGLEGPNLVKRIHGFAQTLGFNLRQFDDRPALGISFDETTTRKDLLQLLMVFKGVVDGSHNTVRESDAGLDESLQSATPSIPSEWNRTTSFLTHPVFNSHHSETELLRYMRRLESRDLSLTTSMISLGSCTMKLNGTSEMFPVTWPEFGRIHPFAPADQLAGTKAMCDQLEAWLSNITGFAAVSLQPNAGSQGEYAGLLAIRGYHESRGQKHRNVCLIPVSAHGTNPASAVIAGFEVVTVACDDQGNVDLADLAAKAKEHAKNLACLMLTYPSTHGVFEADVKTICKIVHDHGGQVYMDGANMNAQVGLTSPGFIGADVCHLNLHNTFCIPHGGGGPGMGPIGVAKHLVPFLPGNPISQISNLKSEIPDSNSAVGPVSSAPYGSASILPISWVYIALMGSAGLKKATQVAILNANYMANRVGEHYPVLFKGNAGLCAHEFIIDCRQFEHTSGIKVEDIAKRLMDYGFPAPTMSFPVPGTLMIEPTESEPKAELDRFCDALIAIRAEIRAIEEGKADRIDNVLKHAPHTASAVTSDAWNHKYPREQAAFPMPSVREHKFWPHVGRIDNPWGDRNLFCTCPPLKSE